MEIRIGEELAGKTVKAVLKGHLGLSSSLLGALKRREGGILRNGRPVFVSALVQAGDLLQVDLSDPPNPDPVPPVPMDLDILYEDEFLLVINKGAPLPVHRSSFAPEEPSLANGLAAYLGPSFTFHPVNRLDRGTTGVMAVAKSGYIHSLLQRQLHTEEFHREYLAVSLGAPSPAAGLIDLPIGRREGSPIQRQIRLDGFPARTEYQVLEEAGPFCLLRLVPRTGRTHQLRLHLSAVGHPLAGDWLYGTEDQRLIGRPALHSARLELVHPVTGRLLSLSAPLPADMAALLAAGPPETL